MAKGRREGSAVEVPPPAPAPGDNPEHDAILQVATEAIAKLLVDRHGEELDVAYEAARRTAHLIAGDVANRLGWGPR